MAGATNRALKAAGIPKSAIKELRVTGGRGLSLRSAISMAGQRGIEIPQKAHDFLAKRDAKSAQKKPADDGAERQRRETAKAEARAVYERGNAASRDRLSAMRGDIRQRVRDVRDAEGVLRGAKDHAASIARKTTPAAKGGPKKRANERERDRAIESKVNNDPSVQRAAMQAKQARMRLQSALASRDATARARKQQRGAESGGQMDLFSGAPAPRAPSPFERRVALRNARERALGDLSRGMLARRKAGAADAAKKAADADFRRKAAAGLDTIAWKRSLAASQAAEAKAKAARIDAKKAAFQRMGGDVTANLMRMRRTQAAARSADNARVASIAAAVERNAARSRFKVEKNVTIATTRTGGYGTPDRKVDQQAIAKAGKHAVVRSERGGYNLIHTPSGLSVDSFSTKTGAMSALHGMASGRGKGSDDMAGGDFGSRAARATRRYMQMSRKREMAYELQKAKESHARAVAGGNQTAIRSAAGRLASAQRIHDQFGYGEKPATKPRRTSK